MLDWLDKVKKMYEKKYIVSQIKVTIIIDNMFDICIIISAWKV